MGDTLLRYLDGLPAFLSYFGVAIALTIVFVLVYTQLTPHHEFRLIKENKSAAAIAFGGSLLGFALPLHAAISHAINLVDCTLWGLVALAVQIVTFFAIRIILRDLPERIARDEIAAGIFVASVSIGVGLLNAASLTY
jgi:putative membrane protein